MRQRVLNNREQPVELHLAEGVVVIPPLGEAEVNVDDAGEPQLEHLADELRVAILPAGEPDASGEGSPSDSQQEEGGSEDSESGSGTSTQRSGKKAATKRSR